MSINNLPLEILQQIFKLICTDGGRTGCVLSLTSHGFRAAARSTRFHTLALSAIPSRLRAFLCLYERECDEESEDGSRVFVTHLHFTQPSLEECVDASYLNDVRRLFRLVALRLHTLVFQQELPEAGDPKYSPTIDSLQPLFTQPFPVLRDLSLVGLSDALAVIPLHASLHIPFFPVVKRVQLVFPCKLPSSLALAHHAPQTTHLLALNVDPSHHTLAFLDVLADVLASTCDAVPAYSQPPLPVHTRRVWPALTHLILQPTPPPSRSPTSPRPSSTNLHSPLETYTALYRSIRRLESLSHCPASPLSPTEPPILIELHDPFPSFPSAHSTPACWSELVRRAWIRTVEGATDPWGEELQMHVEAKGRENAGGAGDTGTCWKHTAIFHPI